MQKYTVHLDKINYFSIDSKIIELEKETVRIVNLRSISGFIGEKFDLSDSKLIELIKHYLVFSNNIELLNIYSRRYNGFNWFEIYSNSKSSEKEFENKQFRILNTSNLNNNSENSLIETINESNSLDESKIKSDIKDQKGMIIPSKLYENMYSNLPKFQKLNPDEMKFVPIWYINGSPQTNAKYCELYTTFEILIHILSKRFITFKSQILSISSTEFQNAIARSYKIDEYSQMKKKALKDLLLQKDERIDELQKTVNEMKQIMMNVNQSNIDLKQEISGLNNKIDTQSKKIDNQTSEIVNLQVKLDDKSTQLETALTNLIEVTNKAQEFKQKSDEFAIIKLSRNRISTGLTNEIFILLFRKDLNDNFHRKFPTESLDVIALDTISCQKENRAKLLKEHKFDEKTCLIIYETDKGNSLDFNRFVKNNAEIIKPIRNSKENPKLIRKFKIHKSNIDYLKSELIKMSNDSESVRDELIKNNQSLIENISNGLENVYKSVKDTDVSQANELKDLLIKINIDINRKLEENKQEIINELAQNKEEIISSLDEDLKSIYDQQVTAADLKIISEKELSILVYSRYREIAHSKGICEYYTEIKNHKPINKKILTVKDLLFGRFRDKDGTIYLPNSDRRSKIAEKYLRQ